MNKDLFVDFMDVSAADHTAQGKYDLAVAVGTVLPGENAWICEDSTYDLCDFIAPGSFPAFRNKADAEMVCELYNEADEQCKNHFVENATTCGVIYWIID